MSLTWDLIAAAMRETDARLVRAEITLLEYQQRLLQFMEKKNGVTEDANKGWIKDGF